MSEEREAALLAEIERLKKINAALIRRVQRSVDAAGSEYGLYEQHIRLEQRVEQRTAELREQNAALAEARLRAEAASEAKARFLATMSHELRTPLNVVIGAAELIDGAALPPEEQHLLSVMRGASQHLLDLIDDILDFSRAEASQLPLRPVPVELPTMLRRLVAQLALFPQARGLDLRLEIGPAVPRGISVDAKRLRQVVSNLVGNACKFTDDGEVTVTVERCGGALRFSVADTGAGIAPEQQAGLFAPFAQADGADSRHHGGAGLGLAISRQLVELWGGQMHLDSVPGAGTTISFTLPLVEATPPAPARAERAPGRPHTAQEVLLVDDHPINRLVARRMLEQLGASVIEASGGQEALDILARSRPDLVLMDCQMPGLDGFETTRRIRQMPAPTGTIPVVALSASVLDEDRQRCFEAGMDAHLTKPILRETLLALLQQTAAQKSA